MPLRFPDQPLSSVEGLQREVKNLLPQIERHILRNVDIGTVETPVAHGLLAAPRMFHATPQADARVWQSSQSDPARIYVKASVSVTCDIEVIP